MEDRTREETVHSSPSTTPRLPLPGKKIQSHSQQLTHIGSHNSNSLLRKHSLEEDRFLLFGGHEYKTRFAEEEKHAQEQEQKEDDEHSTISRTSSYNATTTFHQNSKSRPLPEFIGAGGNDGIFKIPARAAIPPGRPPSLELRSRPLRDTQMGSFLKVISCSDSQLWAGHESGVRCWNLSHMYMTGGGEVVRTGDEDTAPFYESDSTWPVICMTMGMSGNVVWSGHKDGIIRLWNINRSLDGDGDGNGNALAEDLMWRAHRGPVLSLTMTSYGDLWAGCEGGVIKVWPWETVEQSLSLKEDQKDVAALLLERSYLDLRTKVTVNGVCALSHADVLYLLSDISRAKVWSAGHHSFALWDARNRELLKVFNIDGQITRVDMPSTRDASVEDENKTKLSSNSKKEKSQSSLTFLQRSRNAIMGAADAVRRVAVKGTFTDDNQRTEALVLTGDGMIWTGCFSGLLVQWDGNGSRLRDVNHHPFPVRCLCAIGAKIWVGYVTGTVQVLNLNGALLGEWIAHNAPIINMSVGAGYVFTLASHGGIRGWNIVSPGPLDDILRSEISCRESSYTKLEKLKLLVGTWNVGQGKASNDSLLMWLGSVASDISIVVVGLQEVEMGAGFLAMSAARETVGIEGTSIGHWWLDTIGKQLNEGETFERIGSRQLAGLLIALWARKNLRSHIGDIDAAAVPCGFGHAIGNKGGVGLRVRVYDRILCFVNCHLAAHLEAVNRRNSDFSHIYRTMTFNRPNQINGSNGASSPTADSHQAAVGVNSEDRKPELSEADMVIFLGDLNYRLHGISYEEAKDFVSQRCFDWLKERDQLTAEMKAGKVFQGMREGLITFPPTYKFEKRLGGLGGYDSSEKKRIPAWCDRVLYRDNRVASETKCCLDCPVVSSILQYEACMDVTDSDHKPVRCIFSVDIASIDESARRQNFGWIIQSNEKRIKECSNDVPETTVSTNNIIFQGKEKLVLRISNACQKSEAYFEIVCEGQSTIKKDGQGYEHHPRGSVGFPRWLQVSPAAGVIKSGKSAEISMNHEQSCTLAEFVDGIPQNWWCEDARGKEVILTLRVRGSCSPATETHQIRVSHSFASMSKEINSKLNDDRSTRLHHLDSLLQAADTQQSSLTLAMKESRENEIRKNKAGAFQSKSLQEPILRNQNSTSNAADTKHSFHTTSLDGNIRNGARNNGDAGVETMTLFQHLNCSSDAKTQEISHTLSIEENIKKEDRRNTTGEAQSKSLQGADLQCRNSSSHEDNTEPSSHTRLTEEKDNQGARRTKGAENQSKARQQSDLTSDTADSQGKGKIGICNAGEIQSKTIQHAELQHLTLSSHEDGTQPSLRTWLPEEKNNHGARRTKGAESQSKARQQSDLTSDTADSQQNLQIAPIEGKSKFGTRSAGELQSKIVQHVDMPTSNAGDTQHSSRSPSTVEMEKNGAGRRDTKGIQCDVQPYADGIQNNFSTASTEKGRSGARENDVGRIQSKPIQQPFASSSNTSRGRGNSREIQPESSQQPDLQYLNPFFDESETQNSSHITEKGTNGDREKNARGIQPKILEQPDLRHLNPFSDAGDIQHGLPDPATNGTSKNRAQENNDEETKPKIREQSDLRHLNPFSDAGDYQRSLHNPSTEGTSKAGAREKNAEGIQPKMLKQPDLQHRNPFSDAPDNHHSLQDPPTNRMNQTGAQVNNPKGPERPNLQHFNPFSDVTDNQHSSHTPSTNITSRNGAQGNKAKGVQQPGMQHRHLSLDATDDIHGLPNPSTEPDQLHLNPFSDAEDDQHNLHNPSTKRTSGDGVQGNNARETDSQSTSLVQPDMQYLSRSSGAAATQYRLRTTTTEDKNKNRGQENNAKGITRKSLQQPDLPQRNSPSDGAECQQKLYNPSTEENRKTGDRENNSKGNQPKPLQKPDLQHLDCFYDAAGTQHIQHMPLEEERSKSGAQNNNAGRTQSKTSKQTGSENMVNGFFDAADSQHSLNTPATKERSKNAAQENNATTIQSKMPAQSDVQHHSHPSGKADTENRSRTKLTVENNKKGGQENFSKKGIQTFERPDLQHPSQLSDAVATEHKVQTPSKEKKNKNDAREKKTGGSQPKTLQQPDSQPLLSSPDRPETQQSLFTVLTKKNSKGKSKKGTQQDSAKGSQSMCQQPGSQNLDPSSETDSPRCLHTSWTKDKSKSKSKKDSANGVQSMTLQQPDSSQVVRLCDAAATHRSLNTPTVEEKIKTRARKLYLP